ncbi:MAG: toprim domain-containing protein, partial [Patescibacteria group bacterium]
HSYDALTKHLLKIGYSILDIERAGLIFKTDRGTYMDRFRNRIMFPLYNHFGKAIGFTGRVMPGETADVGKYVNSPETPIFNKSKLLFGFYKSKNAIRETKTAVLMEGQMDFIMSWQDGVKNLAATSGTALTVEHLKTLKRAADTLILSFDQDEAGRAATERTIDLAEACDFSVRVISGSPNLKDPADIAKEQPGLMAALINQAQPAMQYYLEKFSVGGKFSNTSEAKQNVRNVLGKIKNIYSPVEKSQWIKEVSASSGIEEKYLLEEMEALSVPEIGNVIGESANPEERPELSKKELIVQRIVSLVMAKKELYGQSTPALADLPADYKEILVHFGTGAGNLPPKVQYLFDNLLLRSSLNIGLKEDAMKHELSELLYRLKIENLKEKRQQLQLSILKAEQQKDDRALMEVLSEFDRVSKEIQNLKQ